MSAIINKQKQVSNIEDCLSKHCKIRSRYFGETVARENLEKQLQILRQENEETKGAMSSLFGVIGILFSFLSGNLKTKIESGEMLTFNDLSQINKLLATLDDSSAFLDLSNLLSQYVKMIKEKENFDSIDELYKYTDNIRPTIDRKDTVRLIQEKVRAVTLYEYRRLIRLEGAKYIQGLIDYSTYTQAIEELTKQVGEIYPK